MATVASGGDDRNVSIGRVFGRGFGTIIGNPLVTLGVAFAFGALPSTLLSYGIQNFREQSLELIGPFAAIAIAIVSIVVAVLLGMITQGALVRATVAYSEGRKASFGESAMAGLSVVVPLFLVGLLSSLGIALGFLLLIVPGVILYVMWSVAAPALVEEKLGPVEALGRSRDLTRGARWKIFGLTLVMIVIYWIFSALIGVIGMMWYGGLDDFALATERGLPLAYLAFSAIVQTITSAVWGVIQTSLYVELRDWKDGPPSEQLAEIFG
ncbi:MAG TPA: glycerophosphoryl diester phosphodiesterase membrane domain-containing protein [Allosphingosinicella sp.]|nr:glycerophosphoryl diester phosphodiesterase membrane domain-containing protein [Allosphingosinicella sp.]